MVLRFRRLRAKISKVLVVAVMPPLGPPLSHVFSPLSSSACLIFPGGCSLIVGDRELYGACHLCASFPEGGAVPATTRNSVGTSACGEEKKGCGWGCECGDPPSETVVNFTTNG